MGLPGLFLTNWVIFNYIWRSKHKSISTPQVDPLKQTATAADGGHPIEMHSC